MIKTLPAVILCASLLLGQTAGITPQALQKHVSYLASDKLGGRPLPSAGLDAAATYLAKEFKTIGLEPAGESGYFQNYSRTMMKPDMANYTFVIQGGGHTFRVLPSETQLFWPATLDLENVEVVKIDPRNKAAMDGLTMDAIKGKVAVVPISIPADGAEQVNNFARSQEKVNKLEPAMILNYGPAAAALEIDRTLREPGQKPAPHPVFPVRTDAFREYIATLPAGSTPLRVTIHLRQPAFESVKLSNIAGVLRGSDPQLKDTYVVVTANYEGFPRRRTTEDHISNSANTNASGTAAVLEIARSLARSGPKPKHSILFLLTSGEPLDGPGSAYYREHPLVPFDKTIACLDLMQLGRTDGSDGAMIGSIFMTGFTRPTVPKVFEASARTLGVSLTAGGKEVESARGFTPLLLDKGVPSHTIYVVSGYADAHRPSDEAVKIDYKNMALVTRVIADGIFQLAETATQ